MSQPLPLNDAPEPPDAAPPKGALGTIFLIVFLDMLGFGIIIPLLPRYIPDYEKHALKVVLLFSVYSICQFIGAPVLGSASDRYGRRPVLVLSQIGSAIGYVLLGVATDWGQFVLPLIYLSRIIDGFTGGNISTAQAYIGDVTSPANRAKGMGIIGASFGIGFAVGPFIGGVLGKFHVSWPAYLAAALAALAAIQTYLRLPETRRHAPTQSEVWLHPSRFAPVLRKPVLMQLMLISFFIMSAFVMMESTMVLFLDKHFGFKELKTGLYFGFMGVVILIVQGGLIGKLTRRTGEWLPAICGPLLVAAGMVGLALTAYYPAMILLLLAGAVNATGRSLYQPTISSLVSKFSDRSEQGVAFGLFHGLGSLARIVGPLAAGLAFPYLRNSGQFILAGGIAVAVAAWIFALKQPAPMEASSDALSEAAIEGA